MAQVVGRVFAIDQQPVVPVPARISALQASAEGRNHRPICACRWAMACLKQLVGVYNLRSMGLATAIVRAVAPALAGVAAIVAALHRAPPGPIAMAKDKTTFTCTECGGTSPRWLEQVPVLRRLEHPDRAGGRSRPGKTA